MSNIADLIEEFILRKLSAASADIVVLRRNELAEHIECAPSQVSYVLSTRFTVDRGFIVESRRGLNGFIRIARVPLRNVVLQEVYDRINADTTPEDLRKITDDLRRHGLLTVREAALINGFYAAAHELLDSADRLFLLQAMFAAVANLPQGGGE